MNHIHKMGNGISPGADLILLQYDDTDLRIARDNLQVYQCGLGICKYARRLHLLGMKWLHAYMRAPDIFELRNARFTYVLLFRHTSMDKIQQLSRVKSVAAIVRKINGKNQHALVIV